MNDAVTMESSEAPVEAVLRAELARGDAVLGTIGPVLGHLLANSDNSLFSDEIVSRVRGMAYDIARQLLIAGAGESDAPDPRSDAATDQQVLACRLLADPALVRHCHALALEVQLASRLENRSAIDPVLSPLLQALIASDDAGNASTAMATLAAQARFIQNQRRMELPLGELPSDLFGRVMGHLLEFDCHLPSDARSRAVDTLRRSFDEGASRIGLLTRLVTSMGAGSRAALAIGHSGVAIFLSALADRLRHERDLAAIVTNERQIVRLGLSLCAAGLRPREIEEQFFHLHPDVATPSWLDLLHAEDAAAILAASGRTGLN